MIPVADIASNTFNLVNRLREISEKIKNAELTNIIADLSLDLAELKMKLASVLEENTTLKQRLHDIENAAGEPCPKCHKRTWGVESSRADPVFENVGGIRRLYKCSACGFAENQFFTPKK
jgi:regulator of replication initiation timing